MNKHGFTLLEVALFLAISGLLALVAFIGMGPRLRNVRFSTGMHEIEDNITKEFSAASLGQTQDDHVQCFVSTDPDYQGYLVFGDMEMKKNIGSQQDCIAVGKLLGVRGDRLEFFTIVARRTPAEGSTNCGEFRQMLKCYRVTVAYNPLNATPVGSDPDSIIKSPILFEFKNNPGYKSISYPSGIRAKSEAVYGFIVNPMDGSRYNFYYFGQYVWVYVSAIYEPDDPDQRQQTVCFELSGRKAALIFDINKPTPELNFEATGC